MFIPEKVRSDFPILSRQVDGNPLIYLDSAATAQKPAAVLDAMDRFYRTEYGSVRRGVHALSKAATRRYEDARRTVAAFLACEPAEVVFTKSATEGINLVAHAWGRANLAAGDAILLTEMEHHANLVPWLRLARERGLELRFGRVTPAGELDREDFRSKLAGTKLIALTQASNVLGTVNPVDELIEEAHAAGAVVLVDGAQALPHGMPAAAAADWYVFSGHKLYGPSGIGVLRTQAKRYGEMEPFLTGGEGVTRVTTESVDYAEPPARFEAGSPPSAEAIGLAVAVDYIASLGTEAIRSHDRQLTARAMVGLPRIPGLSVLGPSERRVGLVAFTVADVAPHDLATLLAEDGLAVRAGRHCAQPLHTRLGLDGSVRASFGVYTTEAEVDRLVEAVRSATARLTPGVAVR